MDGTIALRRRSGWLAGFAAGAIAAAAAVVANFAPSAHSATESPVVVGSFADVVERVSPAVVNIAVTKVSRTAPTSAAPRPQARSPLDEFFGRFFEAPFGTGVPQPRRTEGLGSGFIVDADGYVVTNNHVIDGADEIVVTLQDGRKLDATLVGTDPQTDLALLKVDARGKLPAVAFGDSERARVGDWVIAIGNPFGLGGTATAGIISARGRDIRSGPYDDYLQIDAPINRGNSGGPVFNTAGEVIGVNTAIFSPNGGNIGIGFAIPSSQAKSVVAALRENGAVQRGWLGVQIQELDEEIAASLGLDAPKGALVAEVLADGPAERAGLRAGDVITAFAGREVDGVRALTRMVADRDPRETVTLDVLRDGERHEIRVELGDRSASPTVAAAGPRGNRAAERTLGLALRPLTDRDRAELGLPAGTAGAVVAAVDPGSPAAEKGLQPGDVITQIDRRPVASVDDALAALRDAAGREEPALLLVRRGDSQRFVALGRG